MNINIAETQEVIANSTEGELWADIMPKLLDWIEDAHSLLYRFMTYYKAGEDITKRDDTDIMNLLARIEWTQKTKK